MPDMEKNNIGKNLYLYFSASVNGVANYSMSHHHPGLLISLYHKINVDLIPVRHKLMM